MDVQRRGRENMREHLGREEGIREGFVVEMTFELDLELYKMQYIL